MRIVIIWRDNTDYARDVTEWLENFRRRTGREIESIDPDTMEGGYFVELYGVVEYPTILVLDDSGKMVQQWRGRMMPLVDNVLYYLL